MSTQSPKISIIVPIYGVEKYIERCVRSLFEQTLQEIEYIFIDDCTPDNSINILNGILNEYPDRKEWVRIIKNKRNSGQAFSRQVGMKASCGKYVIQCDSDDWMAKDMYEKLYDYAENNKLDMLWCDYYRSDGFCHKHISQSTLTEKYNLISKFLTGEILASLCNRLYRRELHLKDDFIFPVANMTEDFVISLQITLSSKRIGYLSEPLYYYYANPDSICMLPSEERINANYKDLIQNTDIIISILKKHNLLSRFKQQIICKKVLCKDVLLHLLSQRKYQKLWIRTYIETNYLIFFNKYVPLKTKIRAFFIFTRLYKFYALFYNVVYKKKK